MGKDPLSIGAIPPSPEIVNKFFNDSTGEGDKGEKDARGPWNEAPDLEYVTAPAKLEAQVTAEEVSREIKGASKGISSGKSKPRSKKSSHLR
jgi:Mn-containing catalase